MDKAPVFVIGNPRSGTTLLRLILTSHPYICIPPECSFVVWLYQQYQNIDYYSSQEIYSFVQSLEQCRKFDTWKLEKDSIFDFISFQKPKNYSELCSSIYQLFIKENKSSATIWGDKNNFYIHHIDTLQKIFPQALFLHIVRDPRDIICSYREISKLKTNSPYAPKLPTSIKIICQDWEQAIEKVLTDLKNIDKKRVKQIKYENLVEEPVSVIKDICQWMRIDFVQEMLNYFLFNKKLKLEPDQTLDWKRKTLEPITQKQVGRYKTELNQEEINLTENILKYMMEYFDYL